MPRVVVSEGSRGVGNFRLHQDALLLLRDVVAAVLLIACANLAGLMLARSQTRRREIAVRLSIGASRSRLIRQLLTESLVLSLASGALGVLLARPLLEVVLLLMGGARGADVRLDGRTLLFTLTASIATGLLFGVLPALRTTRVELNPALKEGAAAAGGRETKLIASRVLVAAQIGFSVIMLAGAGLFVRTLINLVSIDLGFRADGLLTFQTRGPAAKENLAELYGRMREGIEAIPGVTTVAMSRHGVLENGESDSGFYLPGSSPDVHGSVYVHECSDSFLSALRTPILEGRDLSPQDGPDAPKVVVVNKAFADRFLRGLNPLGMMIAFGGRQRSASDLRVQIVGVAGNAHYTSVRAVVPPTIYVPYRQNLDRLAQETFVIRTTVPPLSIVNAVRRTVAGIDSTVPVVQLRTMEDNAALSIGRERLMAELVSGFGILAAMLAAIGIFGVLAYTVARRNREIGIRLALGATPARVRGMVLLESSAMVAAGLALGIPGAFMLSRLTEAFLYGVKTHDAWSFVFAGTSMAAVGALAAWLPARRASKVDPMVALRNE
jgi:predicted permease